MSQKNLTEERITDINKFVELGITSEQIELYGKLQEIYTKGDRVKEAKKVFYISIGLLAFGIFLTMISIAVSIVFQETWSYVTSTIMSIVHGIFLIGFKQILQHYYPVIKGE